MFYALLGRLAWFVIRRVLRKRVGRLALPRPLLLAGLVLPVAAAAVRQVRRRSG